MNFKELCKIISENSTFIVVSHIMPDGDSIGSLLAMSLILEKFNKKVVCIINDSIPEKYTFLPGINKILRDCQEQHDVLITLDCGDEDRLGLPNGLKSYAKIVVNIDHHKSNSNFGDLNLVDEHASSVGEILYEIADVLGVTIDYDIALCLYTSIITDTGAAKHSNTTSKSLRILADLVDIGVKPDYISREVFEKRSIEYYSLLKKILDTLEIINDKIAIISITKSMMEETKAKEEDTDGMINYAREIKGIEVAVMFREKEQSLVKVGFRSNEWCDVSRIAQEFGGGGHARASGCSFNGTIQEAKQKITERVIKHIARDINARNN